MCLEVCEQEYKCPQKPEVLDAPVLEIQVAVSPLEGQYMPLTSKPVSSPVDSVLLFFVLIFQDRIPVSSHSSLELSFVASVASVFQVLGFCNVLPS